MTEHRLSIQRACRIVGLSRTAFYRVPKASGERNAAVIHVLNGMVAKRPRWGFWKCYDRMRIEGRRWNHMRVHRVYCALRLNLPRRTKRRLPTRQPLPLEAPGELNRAVRPPPVDIGPRRGPAKPPRSTSGSKTPAFPARRCGKRPGLARAAGGGGDPLNRIGPGVDGCCSPTAGGHRTRGHPRASRRVGGRLYDRNWGCVQGP